MRCTEDKQHVFELVLLQAILADHLDPKTEEQSAIVTLLNIVGQVCLRSQQRSAVEGIDASYGLSKHSRTVVVTDSRSAVRWTLARQRMDTG